MRDPTGIEAILAEVLGPAAPTTLVARIWATVDLDRALAAAGLPAEQLPDDRLLGAFVRLVRPEAPYPAVAFLEPNTEGRLAAYLARFGEGPAGWYVAPAGGLATARRLAARRRATLGRAEVGPFGASVLIPGGTASDPLVVLVASGAGTIDR